MSDAARMRRRRGALMMTTAVVVVAGATTAGYSLGHRPGQVASAPTATASSSPSPATEATEPSQDVAATDVLTSTPAVVEQEPTGPILTRDAAEDLATDSYSFGHNYGIRLDAASLGDTLPAAECGSASRRYVKGGYGDRRLAAGAADVLRSNYTNGCTEAAQAMLERGVYADSTAAPPVAVGASPQEEQRCADSAAQRSFGPPRSAIGGGGDVALSRALDRSTWVYDEQVYDLAYTSCIHQADLRAQAAAVEEANLPEDFD